MKLRISIAILTALSFSGCTSPMDMLSTPQIQTAPAPKQYQQPTPEKTEAYQNTMRNVASGIADDPNYHRIALDTPEKKAWFKDLTYRYWDRQITTSQFIEEGLTKYPERTYEFKFIANGFQKHS